MTTTIRDSRLYAAGQLTQYNLNGTVTGVINTSGRVGGELGTKVSVGNPKPWITGQGFKSDKIRAHDLLVDGTLPLKSYYQYTAATASTGPYPAIVGAVSVNDVLAKTNPSRPAVDIPVMIGEFRDLPQLVYLAGRSLIQKIGSANLSYEFGWKPLLSDLNSLLSFQSTLDRRAAELSAMYQKGGARFRRDTNLWMASESKRNMGSVPGGTLYRDASTAVKRWIVVTWRPDVDVRSSIPSIDKTRRNAFRSAFGLTVDLATIWELLPWSWLIDWFGDIGSYLMAQRNLVGMTPGWCYVMTHTEEKAIYNVAKSTQTVSHSEMYYYRTIKERSVQFGTVWPSASLPIATGRQLGILASLAVLRR